MIGQSQLATSRRRTETVTEMSKQAGAELGQAQLELGFDLKIFATNKI